MDIYTEETHRPTGTYGVPGQFVEPADEPVSEMGGVIWTSRAVRQMQGLRAIAHEYEAEIAERPLGEREVTLVVDGQLINGQFVVDNVEARNHLSGLQATAVQGSKWGKMIIGAAGLALGVILQVQGSNYDAAAYGVALALIVSSLENIFIDKIKKPDPALRGEYRA
ncbi:MAG: hypothetical protein LBF49_01175 [Puniceicoccales bacterium]|jgi:hypothetical protein|nr:hypothetical protein [Puniceicoccales bacterium]